MDFVLVEPDDDTAKARPIMNTTVEYRKISEAI